MPVTSASPGVARVARRPDSLSAFIMRKACAGAFALCTGCSFTGSLPEVTFEKVHYKFNL